MSRTHRWIGRISGLLVAAAATVGVPLAVGGTAHAATCVAPPGAPADQVLVEGTSACGAESDGGGAWGHGDGPFGVGYASGRGGAVTGAAGLAGGAGAVDAAGGVALAVGAGPDALALAILDDPGAAFAYAGAGSQAYIGDRTDPSLCEGGLAVAVNLGTGGGCVAMGDLRWAAPAAH